MKQSLFMNITMIADTHGLHDDIRLTKGDVLIHAGDITEYGTEEEVMDFLKWFSKQVFAYKIFIAGNHDLFLEECTILQRKKLIPKNIIYLNNNGVEINGLKIWGSPVTPYFLGMAFNAHEGAAIKKHWDKIPIETDVLITHGPPFGKLDNELGCKSLLNRVLVVKPKIHCFGHIHEQENSITKNGISFINAAMVNSLKPIDKDNYKIVRKPVIINL
ncbi:MAG: metallophosphatase domain-containing protein [Ferruginibacter sp.]|nr:metallophosphoesterase [Ferruginibacter sp.]